MSTTPGKFWSQGERGFRKKLIAWVEWGQEYAPTCPGCRDTFPERMVPGNAACESCRIELKEENEETARIYQLVRGQVIVFGERIIDISFPAVKIIMDLYEVKDQRKCMERVLRLFHFFLNKSENK